MSQERKLAVIGAGNMGAGIAQKMATEGFRVILVDLTPEALERGMNGVRATLAEAVERKIMRPEQVEAVLSRFEPTLDWSRLAEVELVVEAVFEDLEVKKQVFRRLSENAGPETILATNTSSFYCCDLAMEVAHPERVVGLHYFYHPAKNRLVEVVPAKQTAEKYRAKAWAIQEAIGKTPIHSADAPGFIVNRYFVPWLNESVRLLEEGVADIPTIEAAAKKAFRIGMGPFELMNVTGVPIALHAASTLGRELGPFYAPCARLAEQVEKKELWSLEGEADASRFEAVADRLLATVFLVAGEIIDDEIGSIEDTDIGARVGLRWSKGPFELMNLMGVAKAVQKIAPLCERWDLPIPTSLERQAEKGEPFAFELVQLEKRGDVATLWLNRPDAMNAINEDVVAQLGARFADAEADPEVATIVIGGKGKGFIAGADIRYFVKNIEKGDIAAIERFTREGEDLITRFAASKKVVVARLDGLSLGGGCEIALACDYIVATDKATMAFPETGIGIYPGLGGTQRLPRRVGIPLARWLVLTGSGVDARTALAMGLVDSVVGFEELDAEIARVASRGKPDRSGPAPSVVPAGFEGAIELFSRDLDALRATDPASISDARLGKAVKSLGFKAPIALELADRFIREGGAGALADGLEMELSHLDRIFRTKDAYEGLSTLGKARPVFKGE
ncbi:MAG: 3-hydroxyacyl-CoA dehydrogenase/enoyl-CoA hydratase family protein [Planctomycetota bacterium]